MEASLALLSAMGSTERKGRQLSEVASTLNPLSVPFRSLVIASHLSVKGFSRIPCSVWTLPCTIAPASMPAS